jgi:hypothetical protein
MNVIPYGSSRLTMLGLINGGPNIINSKTRDTKKKMESIITVYMTIETALAPEIFSWDRKKTATADPPMLVGEIAEANSQIQTSSRECLNVKTLSDNILSLME